MTALRTMTAPAPVGKDAQQLEWRRMAWITWRQHRAALIGVFALAGALALVLLIVGLQLHHADAALTGCHPASSAACSGLVNNFNDVGNFLRNGLLLQLVPPLIGAFVGAPILAREFEAGTFRFAWTQGFGRWRWTLAKLVGLGVAVAAAAGALSLLAWWYFQPYFASSNASASGTFTLTPLDPGFFDLRGVAFAAWTLAAFAIGALAGTLIRRVVPAIVTTLVVYGALAFAVGGWLRMHYLTPSVTNGVNAPAFARVVSQWGSRGGRVVFTGRPSFAVFQQYCPADAGQGKGPGPSGDPVQCLAQHGFTFWTSYQPANRFWAFQWIEGGWLLALSILLIAVTVLLVRRRAV